MHQIKELCDRHKIRFRYSFTFVNEFEIRLEGDVIQHGEDGRVGHPSVDHKSQNKGKACLKATTGHDQWADELESRGNSLAELEDELANTKLELRSVESAFIESEKELGRLEAKRSRCRVIFNQTMGEEQSRAWCDLKDAREKVEERRMEDKPLHKRYRALKESVWYLGRLLSAARLKESRSKPGDKGNCSSRTGEKRLASQEPAPSQEDATPIKRQKNFHDHPSVDLSRNIPPSLDSSADNSNSLQEPNSDASCSTHTTPPTITAPASNRCQPVPEPSQSNKRQATQDHHNFVEDVRRVDISPLLNDPTKVAFASTDNGIVAMTTTTRATKEELLEHINYYHAVEGEQSPPRTCDQR
ncbi:hypothetical protein BGW38_001742 [Lunasporangiospora selenospora]|uniref:Uncharacterized protein n=1 Tax=Lunasporangiospora selenospora TaxID=979761 RepID=A0A9P6KDV4_9FUNG|nr:hypothetical protein BGW38_001742 [Lunasporangiospora selenospora]